MHSASLTTADDSKRSRRSEAATRDILDLISRSREDERPVFQAILQRATDLCGADAALLVLGQAGDTLQRLASHLGLAPGSIAVYERGEVSMDPDVSIAARAILSGRTIHIPDMIDTDGYRNGVGHFVSAVRDTGVRSQLFVPLMTPHGGVGCILLYRKEMRPFAPDEITLVETFATQAVIAIENARQFRALQERLSRETATGEILSVISRSPDDDQPVFETIVENALRLCEARMTALILATPQDKLQRLVAHRGISDETVEMFRSGRMPVEGNTSYAARAILEGRVIQFDDMGQSDLYASGSPVVRAMVDQVGIRSVIFVPLMARGGAIGAITVFRYEVRPFDDRTVGLIESFAAQAVIAIENARQFRELQTRLAREAATRRILEAISTSRDDELQVFDAILEEAARLCEATMAGLLLVTDDRTRITYARKWGEDHSSFREGEGWPFDGPLLVSSAIREAKVFHSADLADSDLYRNRYPERVRMVEGEGIRSYLVVPLVSGGIGIGVINLGRRHVGAFLPDEIALVETFAAQAVIAIENVRQFRELQTRLAREAATREILEVISHSRDDDRPVFDAILRNATRLCGADSAALLLGTPEGPHLTLAALNASNGLSQADLDRFIADINRVPMPMDPALHMSARAICTADIVHIADLSQTDGYLSGEASFRFMVEDQGVRTTLAVPIIGAQGPIGSMSVHRNTVRPYTDDEISLIQSFAAQAVIAIENVRQFRALEALNAELGDRVQAQVGEIERMGRLKRFLPAAVADAVVSSGSEKMLKSHRALLGVLFCDIRGFTAFCETAEPEETIEVLQTYHDEMGRLIEAHGAGVDHRMGDGIMVLFNDPLPCDDPAGAAVRLGVAMRARMTELCARWKKMGYRLGFGVGISLGYATVGMVGSGGRFDYTASGTAVNLAARLCEDALDGEILLSQRAATAVEDDWAVEPRGERVMKGIREPVAVFCVTGSM